MIIGRVEGYCYLETVCRLLLLLSIGYDGRKLEKELDTFIHDSRTCVSLRSTIEACIVFRLDASRTNKLQCEIIVRTTYYKDWLDVLRRTSC